MYLQMTFFFISTKAEKNFLYFELISVATSSNKVKFQAINSFDIATIDSAYLNYNRCIIQALLVNHCQWLTCLLSGFPPINQFCPFKTAPHAIQTDVPFSKLSLSSRWIFPEFINQIRITEISSSYYLCENYTFCKIIAKITR